MEAEKSKIVIKGDGPILIVDDDPDFHALIRAVLARSIIKNTHLALQSGEECLDYLHAVIEMKKALPSLILLDVNMPGMDGFKTLERIRSIPDFKEIPLIAMLSNSDDEKDHDKSLQYGADDYLVKPFGLEEFIDLMNSLVPAPEQPPVL